MDDVEEETTLRAKGLDSVKLAFAQLRESQSNKRTKVDQAPSELARNVKRGSKAKSSKSTTEIVSNTLGDDLADLGVDVRISEAIQNELHINNLFAMQQFALRRVISEPIRDVCISAPTGSGKTLMYLIPLLNDLSKRRVVRVRGLVLVPTRELANQVFQTASILANAVGLSCQVVNGDVSLHEEAAKLVRRRRISNLFQGEKEIIATESLVDVLIGTPGRLLDHVDKTAGFTLEHLEWLIVDEADKLLSQSFQDWLDRIYKATCRSPASGESSRFFPIDQVTIREHPPNAARMSASMFLSQTAPRLRRILCSATLTNNPQKLASLALFRPLLIDVKSMGGEDSNNRIVGAGRLSSTLTELGYACKEKNKPVVFLKVLDELLKQAIPSSESPRVLVFASSVSRADRLFNLAKDIFQTNIPVVLMNSSLSQRERKRNLDLFTSGKARIMIASDLAARGVDIPRLEFVLSYDAPSHATTYVHRAGRTARANMPGCSVLLLTKREFKSFQEIQAKLDMNPSMQLRDLSSEDLEPFATKFEVWRNKDAQTISSSLND